jgi:hypothetical protein
MFTLRFSRHRDQRQQWSHPWRRRNPWRSILTPTTINASAPAFVNRKGLRRITALLFKHRHPGC